MNERMMPIRQPDLSEGLRQALQERISGRVELPLFPDTAVRIMEACKDDQGDMQRVTELITHDQAVAVHVLRVSNSAAYAPREPIVSLQQAIARLGLTTVSEIAVAVSIKNSVFCVPGHHARLRELWMHSAAAAAYAKEIATLKRTKNESVFLCGLLHDVGMPMTMQVLCELQRERGEQYVPRAQMEAAMLSFHRELGGLVTQKWGLGAWVVAAIRFHHEPRKATAYPDEVLTTALADDLAYWALDGEKTTDEFRSDFREPMGLSDGELRSLLGRRGRVLAVTEAFS